MPPLSDKVVQGPDHAVPCPHCGQNNDFTEVADVVTPGTSGTGHIVICDHCGLKMITVKVQTVTIVAVKQAP